MKKDAWVCDVRAKIQRIWTFDKLLEKRLQIGVGEFFYCFLCLGLGFSGRIRLLPDLGLDS